MEKKAKDSETDILRLKERVAELENKATEDVGINFGSEASVTGSKAEKKRHDSSTCTAQALLDLQQEAAGGFSAAYEGYGCTIRRIKCCRQ